MTRPVEASGYKFRHGDMLQRQLQPLSPWADFDKLRPRNVALAKVACTSGEYAGVRASYRITRAGKQVYP